MSYWDIHVYTAHIPENIHVGGHKGHFYQLLLATAPKDPPGFLWLVGQKPFARIWTG